MRWTGLETRLIPYADAAVRMGQAYGINPVVTSVRRNWAEQEELYSRYRSGVSRFPANPPGQSGHQYGVAWDSSVKPEHQALWDQIRSYYGWKLYPNDPVHAELPNWQKYRGMLKLT